MALDDFELNDKTRRLLNVADIVKLDLRTRNREQLRKVTCDLRNAGIPTLLIEAEPLPTLTEATFDGRSSAIAYGSQQVLAGVGAWDYLAADASPIREIRASDGGWRSGLAKSAHESPFFVHYNHRDLPEGEPYDSVASVGMFEHVGLAQLPAYFGKVRRLLKPGGLLLNHGISAGGTRNGQLGAGIGDFIERNIFPGGELLHISHALKVMSEAGLEPLDAENLRPHYARTLWAWSDRLEARLAQARQSTQEPVLRAYRLYLAGSAMSFEQGWISLYQVLAGRPSGSMAEGPMRGAQSRYPFNREYMYNP